MELIKDREGLVGPAVSLNEIKAWLATVFVQTGLIVKQNDHYAFDREIGADLQIPTTSTYKTADEATEYVLRQRFPTAYKQAA
jgi:hypothetical protein